MYHSTTIQNMINFDEVCPILQEFAINRIIDCAEGIRSQELSSEEYMTFYTLVYNSCCGSQDTDGYMLYNLYRNAYEDHVSSKALPSLRGRMNENLLQELLRRWKIHKTITRRLIGIFSYIERNFICTRNLPSLVTTSHSTFFNLVYGEMNGQIQDAIISLINKGREGEQINQALLKESLDLYIEIGEGSRRYYVTDFEEAFMNNTRAFYSRKASEWISNESYEGYMLKVEECLNQERNGVSNYLKSGIENKALEINCC